MWFNKNHLTDASENSKSNLNYFTHFNLAIKEAAFCQLIAIGSLIHAIFPWVLDFKLLEWRIMRLKKLKEELPNDALLKKVHFDD
jgi:hypothetical protein